jgi:hypothetical protein
VAVIELELDADPQEAADSLAKLINEAKEAA